VVVTARRASPASSSSSLPPGSYAALDVEDEGKGLAADVRGRLFSPFFTTKPPGQGTGLGLAVAWGIVKENGGAIEVIEPEGGATGAHFRILLPEVP
jgi:C4-dicarboxylate-specific signal transduction histidine kinase